MPIEIERKFLVENDAFKSEAFDIIPIRQGFLSTDPKKLVRIRISGEKAWLTIKGMANSSGTTRLEWEKEIDKEEAAQLMLLCEQHIIEKTRYLVTYQGHIFEVDVFEGENEGLILAELELKYELEPFGRPDWLGKEVTSDHRYFNISLVFEPYSKWT